MSRPSRLAAVLVIVALLVVACGDSPEEQLVESLSGGDVELDDNDGGFSVRVDDGEGSFGEDLDAPDWLPRGFPLPDTLSIQAAVDENDVQTIIGSYDGTASGDYRDAVLAWLDDAGYTVLDDVTSGLGEGGFRLAAVDDADRVIDLDAARGGFQLQLSMRDVTFDRQEAAEVVQTTGVATLEVDGEIHTVEGDCRIQGADYSFQGFTDDGTLNVLVELFTLNEPVTGSVFAIVADEQPRQYAVTLTSTSAADAVVTAGSSTFGVEGGFVDALDFSPVDGSVVVDCG